VISLFELYSNYGINIKCKYIVCCLFSQNKTDFEWQYTQDSQLMWKCGLRIGNMTFTNNVTFALKKEAEMAVATAALQNMYATEYEMQISADIKHRLGR
jgi:hypothetical protein